MEKGKHLLIEAITKDENLLTDKKFIQKLFRQIIKLAKMKALSPILIYQFPSPGPKLKGGLTAFVVLAESHLSIHTWPEKNYFALDLFSCGDFKEKLILKTLKQKLVLKNYQFKILRRGLKVKRRD